VDVLTFTFLQHLETRKVVLVVANGWCSVSYMERLGDMLAEFVQGGGAVIMTGGVAAFFLFASVLFDLLRVAHLVAFERSCVFIVEC
jgi:hypothetical protein